MRVWEPLGIHATLYSRFPTHVPGTGPFLPPLHRAGQELSGNAQRALPCEDYRGRHWKEGVRFQFHPLQVPGQFQGEVHLDRNLQAGATIRTTHDWEHRRCRGKTN